jgi:hypothetical protein
VSCSEWLRDGKPYVLSGTGLTTGTLGGFVGKVWEPLIHFFNEVIPEQFLADGMIGYQVVDLYDYSC